MKTSILIAAIALSLTACGTLPSNGYRPQAAAQHTPETAAATVKKEYDGFKKMTKFTGKDITYGGLSTDSVFIRATFLDEGPRIYQIYGVSNYYREWRFYNSIYDSKGQSLPFQSISRSPHCNGRGSCLLEEHFTANVTRDYLQANAESGITFKVSGSGGEQIFTIPAVYIQGFLKATQ